MPSLFDVKHCPACGALSIVKDSRSKKDGSIRRRRACTKCSRRWSTTEYSTEDIKHVPTDEQLSHIYAAIGRLRNATSGIETIVKQLSVKDTV